MKTVNCPVCGTTYNWYSLAYRWPEEFDCHNCNSRLMNTGLSGVSNGVILIISSAIVQINQII